jgi:GTPase SAR1 family protein
MQEIIQEIQSFLSTTVEPIQKRFLFHGCPSEAALKDTPTILMLGNHSSGKSSFINYFIQRDVQQTGMAPTDEDFTIIRYGQNAKERPGTSLVSNPEFGYEGLSQFGPKFLSHLKMKSLALPRLESITLIDTPGMIDSADAQAHRGYDFQGVVRWFAERADLIMLFFDPERPGTTAETLQVYTQALGDFDHKLMVVMNKVDMFRKLPDFARCYGTLCWNLGKVMRTKDLPQIYVTYLPIQGNPPSALPMAEFDLSRQKLIQKMEHTAFQRADNLLTEVTIYLDRLFLHTKILDSAKKWYTQLRNQLYFFAFMIGSATGAWLYFTQNHSQNIKIALAIAPVVFSLFMANVLLNLISKIKLNHFINQPQNLFDLISSTERLKADRFEQLKAHWKVISEHTTRTVKEIGLANLPKIKTKEALMIGNWLEVMLPALRSKVHQAEDQIAQEIRQKQSRTPPPPPVMPPIAPMSQPAIQTSQLSPIAHHMPSPQLTPVIPLPVVSAVSNPSTDKS